MVAAWALKKIKSGILLSSNYQILGIYWGVFMQAVDSVHKFKNMRSGEDFKLFSLVF